MAVAVIMPRQGQSVETCVMGEWHKQVGEKVYEGDILFSYETDKASFEEEAKCDGVLLAHFFEEGDEVPVLINVAVIGDGDEDFKKFQPQDLENNFESPVAEESLQKQLSVESSKTESSNFIRISPLARKIANDNSVNLQRIIGTGPNKRIIARDIQEVIKKKEHHSAPSSSTIAAAPAKTFKSTVTNSEDVKIEKLSNVRKLIAKSMHHSLQNSAQLTHHMGADARKLLTLRRFFKKEFAENKIGQNITLNDLICFAVIKALKKFPQVNTHFLGDSKKLFNKVNLGIAVDTERGLMVPTILDADDYSIEGLSSRLKDAAQRCRKGNFDVELLKPESATFTISNLGNYGVEMFTPVINLPQSAILGVCAMVNRPVTLDDGTLAFVPYLGLSLTYDHRSLDGGEATLFLQEIRNQIENIDC